MVTFQDAVIFTSTVGIRTSLYVCVRARRRLSIERILPWRANHSKANSLGGAFIFQTLANRLLCILYSHIRDGRIKRGDIKGTILGSNPYPRFLPCFWNGNVTEKVGSIINCLSPNSKRFLLKMGPQTTLLHILSM